MGGFYAENYAVFATGNMPFITRMGGEMNTSEIKNGGVLDQFCEAGLVQV